MQTTAIIKAFERPGCLRALLTSLRAHYPTLPVIVADDSRTPAHFDIQGVTWHQLPFDVGLSAGRNFLVDHVTTEYTLLLDDDYLVTPKTDIARLERILDTTELDLVGGRVMNVPFGPMKFEGKLQYENGVLTILNGQFHSVTDEYSTCDILANFFLARTRRLQEVRWDPELKLCEHVEFFMRAHKVLRIGFCPHVVIHHDRSPSPANYVRYRQRVTQYKSMFYKKCGIKTIATQPGDVPKPMRVKQPRLLLTGTGRRSATH